MKKLIVLFFYLSFISCISQEISIRLSYEQSEVLKVFLSQQELYSYVDKHLSNKNRIGLFTGKYRDNRKFYRVADSICKTNSDTLKLKFYCPIADSFKKYEDLLIDDDLSFMISRYNKNKERVIINIDSLLSETTLRKHSKEYYKQIVYEDGLPDLREFPSITIDNIYFNKTENVAVVAYTISEQINYSFSNFFLLEKKDNLWWKPLGNLFL